MAAGFIDNAAQRRFELSENGHIAFANYRIEDGQLVIPYVEAPMPLRGTGAAGRLLTEVVTEARRRNLKIVPLCGYAAAWFHRHPEYRDSLA